MLAWIMALLTAYVPICDCFCWTKKKVVCVQECMWVAECEWVDRRRAERTAKLT